jgi:signal peptidase II
MQARSKPKARLVVFARAGAVMCGVLVLDQVTKAIVRSSIAVGQVTNVAPGVHFVHVRNTGVAFGFLSGGGALVLAFTFAALAVLLVYFARHPDRPWLWLPAGLLTGGALGNLFDRLAHGAVTDFIKLPDWPAFNVADIAITVGVVSLLFVLEGGRRGSE